VHDIACAVILLLLLLPFLFLLNIIIIIINVVNVIAVSSSVSSSHNRDTYQLPCTWIVLITAGRCVCFSH